MVRSAHRTFVARLLAICLLAFAISPVTAPFTTLDLSDFAPSHAPDTPAHHPGRHLAEPHGRVTPHVGAMTLELAPRTSGGVHGLSAIVVPQRAAARHRGDLRSILRL